ncbi:hypothetical protein EB796_017740 [Bugula neritina]|uniref:Uncharacterized protein n=1 Tax=Bugula neritina TaxID=10212 RepID=A0A7J7JCX3_BUGNE|nr:hypothetical protein EB796_017740 [Bugula neritina]
MNGSRNGMLIGAPLGVLATYGAMRSTSKKPDVDMDYEYFDRAYRLRHNRGQVRVDRASIIVSGVGVATAVAQGSSVLGGGALGLAAGTLLGAVYNATIKSQ